MYPALSVLQEIRRQQNSGAGSEAVQVLYVGASNGLEKDIVPKEGGYPFAALKVRGLRGANPWALAGGSMRMTAAVGKAHGLIGAFRPQVVFGTGGYVCVPVFLAAWMRRVPSVLFLPDLVPGWAGRFLARFATRVCVAFADSAMHLPGGKTVVTGYPVRASLLEASRESGRRYFGMRDGEQVVLVFGGSRGAHSINLMLQAALPRLLDHCAVIHVSGAADYAELAAWREGLPKDRQRRYHLHAYLHDEMASALAAADLAVCRSGASTLAELPLFALPAVLIPYPYAGAHQELNAQYLARHGASVRVTEQELGFDPQAAGHAGDRLASAVLALLEDRRRLGEMAACAGRLARPEAARVLVQQIEELVGSA